MNLSEEYRLAEYEELKKLHGRNNICIVRNQLNGMIAVKKLVSAQLKDIYIYLKNLKSPYIPQIYECIENGDELIVIEEYLAGRNLDETLMDRDISEKEAVSIIVQLCRALKPLHLAEPAIICRDLKASNVMITMNQEVKIIDFDIARIYQSGQRCDTELMGTKEYAAPEQYGFRQTDARTDIYAMGVLLNYMILRKYPVEMMVDGRLKTIVGKCLEMNPDDRYQSVDELKEELEHVYKEEKIADRSVQLKNKQSYMIPGFRSHTIWKMISAVCGYLFVIWMAFTMEFTDEGVKLTGVRLRFEQMIIWLTQIALIFLIWDYRGIRELFPIVNSSKRWMRIAGYIVAEFVLLISGAIVCVIFESIFF